MAWNPQMPGLNPNAIMAPFPMPMGPPYVPIAVPPPLQYVNLNLRGRYFTVPTADLLRFPKSTFAMMLSSGIMSPDGSYYFNRSPEGFEILLRYLHGENVLDPSLRLFATQSDFQTFKSNCEYYRVPFPGELNYSGGGATIKSSAAGFVPHSYEVAKNKALSSPYPMNELTPLPPPSSYSLPNYGRSPTGSPQMTPVGTPSRIDNTKSSPNSSSPSSEKEDSELRLADNTPNPVNDGNWVKFASMDPSLSIVNVFLIMCYFS